MYIFVQYGLPWDIEYKLPMLSSRTLLLFIFLYARSLHLLIPNSSVFTLATTNLFLGPRFCFCFVDGFISAIF